MNERIEKLANVWANLRAKDDRLGITYTFSEKALEKFAELIVQEILRLLEQYSRDSFPEDFIDNFDKGYLAGLCTAQEAVKKHFGVEE